MVPFVTDPRIPTSFLPRPGESVRSYVLALAEANGYREVASFQLATGLKPRLTSFAPAPQWEHLAWVTGLPVEAFSGLRRLKLPSPRDSRRVSFLGGAVSSVHLDKLGHKVCPQCLAEDGYGRDLWSLHYALACPRHRVLLADTCHECGQLFGLYRWAKQTGCACGGDLRQAPTVRAGDRVVAAVAAITQIAADGGGVAGTMGVTISRALPEALLTFTLNEVLDFFHVIGAAALAKPSRERAPPRRDGSVAVHLLNRREILQTSVPERLEILDAAVRVMEDWPAAFWRALDGLEGHFSDLRAKDPMGRKIGTVNQTLVELALQGRHGRPLPLLWDALDEYRRRRRPGRPGATLRTTDPVASRLGQHLSVVSLCAAHGLTYGFAKRIFCRVIAGLEPDLRVAPDHVLIAEFRRRYAALTELMRNSISQSEVCSILIGEGVKVRFADWHAPDLLPLVPGIQGLKGTTRYDPTVVRGLLARLRRGAQPVAGLDGLLRIASHAFMGRLPSPRYGRAEVLRDMLAGRLPYYAAVPGPKYADLHVDPEEATVVLQKRHALARTMEARFVSWSEARTLFAAAFGLDGRCMRARPAGLHGTGAVACLRDGRGRFYDREQLFAWADAHLAPPGKSIRAFLDEAGLHVTERVRYHRQPYNLRRLRLPSKARPRRRRL